MNNTFQHFLGEYVASYPFLRVEDGRKKELKRAKEDIKPINWNMDTAEVRY